MHGYQTSSSLLRRKNLLEEMKLLKQREINCYSCTGLCCTYRKNSMRITPVEAIDIISYLKENKRWTKGLVEDLQNTISSYRLDSTLMVGTRTMRRTYTCTFFKDSRCTLGLEVKPYGCLAFNAREVGEKEGLSCRSDQEALIKRESLDPQEELINQNICERLKLSWRKESIPVALLEVESHWAQITRIYKNETHL